MGQYLSAPETTKYSENGGAGSIDYGASGMQGWRMSMEDAHIANPAIDGTKGMFAVFDGHGGAEVALFCRKHMTEELLKLSEYKGAEYEKALTRVFHRMDEMIASGEFGAELEMMKTERQNAANGSANAVQSVVEGTKPASGQTEKKGENDSYFGVAAPQPNPSDRTEKLRQQLKDMGDVQAYLQKLQESSSSNNGKDGGSIAVEAIRLPVARAPAEAQNSGSSGPGGADAPQNLRAFSPLSQFEEQQCRLPDHPITAGCTAVVALIVDGEIIVANAGDSKAVLSRNGRAIGLSFEHKPFNDVEKRRIEAAGGFVSQAGRVNNNLNLSRSIGDLKYKGNTSIPPKDQMITSEPDLCREKIQPEDEFVIIACDGVWDVMQNQEAVNFVRERINVEGKKLSDICEEMFMACLAQDPKRTSGLGGDNMTAVIIRLKHDGVAESTK